MKHFLWLLIPFSILFGGLILGNSLWGGEYQAPIQEISMGLLFGLLPLIALKFSADVPLANDRAMRHTAIVIGIFFLISRIVTAAAYVLSPSEDLIFLLGAGLAGMTVLMLPASYLIAKQRMPDSQPIPLSVKFFMAGAALIGCAGMAFAPILVWLPSVNCLIIPVLFVPGALCCVIGYFVLMREFNQRMRRI